MCQALRLETLFFRTALDYSVPRSTEFKLPERIFETSIINVPHFHTWQEYNQVASRFNLFIAPRFYEGIGLTVTEAMARGSVVLGNNAPTMNEYIIHGHTGIFLPYCTLLRHFARAKSKAERYLGLDYPQISPLVGFNWYSLAKFDLLTISENARAYARDGYRQFQGHIPDLVDYLLGW